MIFGILLRMFLQNKTIVVIFSIQVNVCMASKRRTSVCNLSSDSISIFDIIFNDKNNVASQLLPQFAHFTFSIKVLSPVDRSIFTFV